MTEFEKVREFNREVLGIEERTLDLLERTELVHFTNCINEELDELKEAVENTNFVAAIDAVMDIIYFSMGALYKMGVTNYHYTGVFAIIHKWNMKKSKGTSPKEHRAIENVVDAIKPDNWTGPEEEIGHHFFME